MEVHLAFVHGLKEKNRHGEETHNQSMQGLDAYINACAQDAPN